MHQVFVTSDGRYIVTEPLYVLDVREWKQYALFESLQIPNYTKIEAISRDGKRLFNLAKRLRDRLQRFVSNTTSSLGRRRTAVDPS